MIASIELDMAMGLAKTVGAVVGALLMVAGVTWCAKGTDELLQERRKGRRK